MIFATHPEPPDQQEFFARRRVRALALLLLVLLLSLICMFMAAQVALLNLNIGPLGRDVRSVIEVDYGAGAQRVVPLDPKVIKDVEKELELTQIPAEAFPVPFEPMVEIPTRQPTAVAQVSPTPTATPSPTATPRSDRPTDTRQPATRSPTPTSTSTPFAVSTATPPQATATHTSVPTTAAPHPPTLTPLPPTSVPTSTPVPPVTPTSTPVPGPTDTPVTPATPTLTETPMPTDTPTPTDTPVPTNTPVPTDTPVPSNTPTPTFTPTHTALPPMVLGITPVATVQGGGSDPDFDVVIVGQNFMAPVTAWLGELGQNILVSVAAASGTHITGTLSPNIPVGIYGLTVQNADARTATRSPAFTIYPRPHPATTFDSAVAFVSTFGPAAPPGEGDSDHIQIVFFEVPDTAVDNLYVRIFDADTGGLYDQVGQDGSFNTTITFTLRGGAGAYSNPEARSHAPGSAGINSGTLVVQNTIGVSGTLDNTWLTLPVNRIQGELVEGSRLFKLSVQGAAGDDGNRYHVALSSDPSSNVGVTGARLFAYSWTILLPAAGDEVAVHPYVPFDVTNVTQVNFDFDVSPNAGVTLTTPLRNLPVSAAGLSGAGTSASETFVPFAGEQATTWTARYTTGEFTGVNNDFSIWFFGDSSQPLAVFTGPTLVSDP